MPSSIVRSIRQGTPYILVDTQGLVLEVRVQAADVPDRDGAQEALMPLPQTHWRLKKIWADASYRGELVEWVHTLCQGRGQRRIELEIVAKTPDSGFVVLPKRWIVECTCAWLGRSR